MAFPHYVVRTGTREMYFRTSDFAFNRDIVDGVIVLISNPPRLHYVWPMHVGQTWDQTYVEERPKDRQTSERVDAVTVEAEEAVTVHAGAFQAPRWSTETRRVASSATRPGTRQN